MGTVSGSFKCPGCGLGTAIEFKKPGVITPKEVRTDCTNCGSDVMFSVKRDSTKTPAGPRQISLIVSARVIRPSEALRQMQREEAAHNAAPLET